MPEAASQGHTGVPPPTQGWTFETGTASLAPLDRRSVEQQPASLQPIQGPETPPQQIISVRRTPPTVGGTHRWEQSRYANAQIDRSLQAAADTRIAVEKEARCAKKLRNSPSNQRLSGHDIQKRFMSQEKTGDPWREASIFRATFAPL